MIPWWGWALIGFGSGFAIAGGTGVAVWSWFAYQMWQRS